MASSSRSLSSRKHPRVQLIRVTAFERKVLEVLRLQPSWLQQTWLRAIVAGHGEIAPAGESLGIAGASAPGVPD